MAFPTGWTRRAAITVGTVSGTHTDFPAFLTEAQLADALAEGQTNGGDLRFSSDEAGTTQLACHVVEWDTVGSNAVVWVKVPSLATGSTIYAWWDTSGTESQPAVGAAFGRNAVWSDYAGVWIGHDLTDATGNGGDLTADSGVTAGNTRPELEFEGFVSGFDTGLFTDNGPTFTTSDVLHLTIWNRPTQGTPDTNFAGGFIAIGQSDNTDALNVGRDTSQRLFVWTNGGNTGGLSSPPSLPQDQTKRIDVNWNQPSNTQRWHVDGVLAQTVTGYTDTSSGNGRVAIGRDLNGDAQACFSSFARFRFGTPSDDRIATEYDNENDPATFSTAAASQDVGAGTQNISPGLFTNAQAFFAPAVAAGAVALSPPLTTNNQTFFAPTVSTGGAPQTLEPALYTNAQTFPAPTVEAGAVTVAPPLTSNAQTFYAATVSQPAVAQDVSPPSVTNNQAFFSPSVQATYTLAPAQFTNAQTFFSPSIASGPANLTPALVTNQQIFFAASVADANAPVAPEPRQVIPEYYRQNDWPRKVAQMVNRHDRELEDSAQRQGAVWHNFAISPSIPANTWTTLDFTAPITIRNVGNQQTYLNNGYIRADDNEWFQLRIDITFSADDATASFIRFGLTDDTPGGFGTFTKPLHPVLLGAGIEDEATFSFPTFSEYALNANGWLPEVLSDGPISITQVQMFVTREVG